MKTRTSGNMKKAFQDIYTYLIKNNHKLKLQIMDNECSDVVVDYIKNEINTKLQFVEAHLHQFNDA